MIVFALYLHVCTTQLTSMHGGAPAKAVTACSLRPRGNPYATQALCDAAGKAAVAQKLQEQPVVDAYQCQALTVNSK